MLKIRKQANLSLCASPGSLQAADEWQYLYRAPLHEISTVQPSFVPFYDTTGSVSCMKRSMGSDVHMGVSLLVFSRS